MTPKRDQHPATEDGEMNPSNTQVHQPEVESLIQGDEGRPETDDPVESPLLLGASTRPMDVDSRPSPMGSRRDVGPRFRLNRWLMAIAVVLIFVCVVGGLTIAATAFSSPDPMKSATESTMEPSTISVPPATTSAAATLARAPVRPSLEWTTVAGNQSTEFDNHYLPKKKRNRRERESAATTDEQKALLRTLIDTDYFSSTCVRAGGRDRRVEDHRPQCEVRSREPVKEASLSIEQKKIEALDANAMYERTRASFRRCGDTKHGPWFDQATFKLAPRVPYSRDYVMYPHRNELVTAVREYPCQPDGTKPPEVMHHEEFQSPYFPLQLGQFYDKKTGNFYESQKLYPTTLGTLKRLEIFSKPCKRLNDVEEFKKKNEKIAFMTNLQLGYNLIAYQMVQILAVVHEHMKRAMLAFTLDDFFFEMHGRFAVTEHGVCYSFSPKDRVVLNGTEYAVPIYDADGDIPSLAERREVVQRRQLVLPEYYRLPAGDTDFDYKKTDSYLLGLHLCELLLGSEFPIMGVPTDRERTRVESCQEWLKLAKDRCKILKTERSYNYHQDFCNAVRYLLNHLMSESAPARMAPIEATTAELFEKPFSLITPTVGLLRARQWADLHKLVEERLIPETREKPWTNYEDMSTAIFANIGLFDENYFHRCTAYCGNEDDPTPIKADVYATQFGSFSLVVKSRKSAIFTREHFAIWCEKVIGKKVRKSRTTVTVTIGREKQEVHTMDISAANDATPANVDACEFYQMFAPWNKDQISGAPKSKTLFVSKFVKCPKCAEPTMSPNDPAPKNSYAEPEWKFGKMCLRCEEIKGGAASAECLREQVAVFNPYPDKLDDSKRIFYTLLDFVRSYPTKPDRWGIHAPLFDPLDRKGLAEMRFTSYSDTEMERCHWLPTEHVPWTTSPRASIRFGPDYNAKAGGVLIFKFTYRGVPGVTSLPDLDYDANRIREVFGPKDFTVFEVPNEMIRNAKAMIKFLAETMRTLPAVKEKGEALWLFFLGHGGEVHNGAPYIDLWDDNAHGTARDKHGGRFLLDDILWFLNTYGEGDVLLGKHRIVVWAPCSGWLLEQSQTHRQPPVYEWKPTVEHRQPAPPAEQTNEVLEAVANIVKDLKTNTKSGKPWHYLHDLTKNSFLTAPLEDALTQSSLVTVVRSSTLGTASSMYRHANPDRTKKEPLLAGTLIVQSLLNIVEFGGDIDLAGTLEKVN